MSCPPLPVVNAASALLPSNPAVFPSSDDLFENLVVYSIGTIPVVGFFCAALVQTFWPSNSAAEQDTLYGELACATRSAINLGVYNNNMQLLRGYLIALNASLQNIKADLAQNLSPCADYVDAYQTLRSASYFVQAINVTSQPSQLGAAMPLLLTLAYSHLTLMKEILL